MRIWTFIKLVAALVVLGILVLTGLLVYHITVKPLGGVFEKVLPNPTEVVPNKETELTKMPDSAEMPDVEPGEKAYQKAVELIAMGKISEAREKLETIVNIFPTSSSAVEARRILGEMNLDEVLSPQFKDGKRNYTVKRGDSFLKISNETKCSLDCIMYLNGLTDYGGLQPGGDLLVMEQEFRVLIEPQKKSISLWRTSKGPDGADRAVFVKDYPIIRAEAPANVAALTTTIDGNTGGYMAGKKLAPGAKTYRASEKIIYLSKFSIPIRGLLPTDKDAPAARGFYLKPSDMEELMLLIRPGNEVEIRPLSR